MISWISSVSGHHAPANAIEAGRDSDGTIIYAGRAEHKGSQTPAKVLHSKKVAYISYGGQEIVKHQYEILCGTGFSWVHAANGSVPSNAFVCGRDGNEVLYIGRTNHNGSLTIGKIVKSHNCLYIPYGGQELKFTNYEVLVQQTRSEWVRMVARSPLPYGAVSGGHDKDGSAIYVGRAFYSHEHLPAKVIPSKQAAYVAFNGGEHLVEQYDVLCNGNTRWDRFGGHIPINAVKGGRTQSGEILYIGRGNHEGSLTVGKIHPSHGSLYIPFGGSEVALKHFEILVEN